MFYYVGCFIYFKMKLLNKKRDFFIKIILNNLYFMRVFSIEIFLFKIFFIYFEQNQYKYLIMWCFFIYLLYNIVCFYK